MDNSIISLSSWPYTNLLKFTYRLNAWTNCMVIYVLLLKCYQTNQQIWYAYSVELHCFKCFTDELNLSVCLRTELISYCLRHILLLCVTSVTMNHLEHKRHIFMYKIISNQTSTMRNTYFEEVLVCLFLIVFLGINQFQMYL